MDTRDLDSLVRFCAGQARRFDPDAWRENESLDRDALAVAAKYLSMTSWYGHEAALERVAEKLRPEMSSTGTFDHQAAAIGFELSYFSVAVRYRIVMGERSGPRKADS